MVDAFVFVLIFIGVCFLLFFSRSVLRILFISLSAFIVSAFLSNRFIHEDSLFLNRLIPFKEGFYFEVYQIILGILGLLILLYTVSSVRIIKQGEQALVERVGRYHRKLQPGLNFIVPILDSIVLSDSVRERILDIEPRSAVTRDNVPVDIEAVVYWRILELERKYYEVEDAESAIAELVLSTLRSEVGKMDFEQTSSSRDSLNQALLYQLDEATEPWGIKVTRVEVQEISTPPAVQESMEQQRASEIRRRSRVLESEGEKQAAVQEAEGLVQAIQLISSALPEEVDPQSILNYLLAQRYISANQKLGESANSKVIFMDPKAMTEGLSELIGPQFESDYFDKNS